MNGDSELLELLDEETSGFIGDLGHIDESSLQGGSRLPGWSRAHTIVHLARNADGLRNLLLAARSGEEIRMYASPTTRVADINSGVTRPTDVILADAAESSRRFTVDARALSEELWDVEVALTSGQPDPRFVTGRQVIALRLEEVAIHRVDLGIGREFVDLPHRLLVMFVETLGARRALQGVRLAIELDDAPDLHASSPLRSAVTIAGSASDVAAWLAGRSDGAHLRSTTEVPTLPSLG